jgi:DNA-binding response OmpR family regulator
MKVLIVENERDLSQAMLRHFKREGHVCELAETCAQGLVKASNYGYDCAIISLDLPGRRGLALGREFRRARQIAGIILIAMGAPVEERVQALEEGADDFLLKPFHLAELSARLKAVMRRHAGDFERPLCFGRLSIQPSEHLASIDGAALKLTKKEFEILLYLARNKNRVIAKESLAEHLWGDHMDDPSSYAFIYAHMKNLRKKLVAHAYGDHLKTLYGIGYKFEPG